MFFESSLLLMPERQSISFKNVFTNFFVNLLLILKEGILFKKYCLVKKLYSEET